MIRFLFIICTVWVFNSVLGTAYAEMPKDRAWDNRADEAAGPVIAFVGEKIFVEERNLEETMEFKLPDGRVVTRILPKMSDRYEARYKIIDVIGGDYDGGEIDFEAFDHYGRPSFSKINPVLLFVQKTDKGWGLQQYLTTVVFETTDGDWAMCGGLRTSPWTEKFEPFAKSYEEPIGFLTPYEIASGELCTSGVRASKIFDFHMKTHFDPQRRRVACNREMGEADAIHVGTGSLPGAAEKKQIHDACMAKLEVDDGL